MIGAQFVLLTRIMFFCLDIPVTELVRAVGTDFDAEEARRKLTKLIDLWVALRALVILCSAFKAWESDCLSIQREAGLLNILWEKYLGARL